VATPLPLQSRPADAPACLPGTVILQSSSDAWMVLAYSERSLMPSANLEFINQTLETLIGVFNFWVKHPSANAI
jgi:hypothetical protein